MYAKGYNNTKDLIALSGIFKKAISYIPPSYVAIYAHLTDIKFGNTEANTD